MSAVDIIIIKNMWCVENNKNIRKNKQTKNTQGRNWSNMFTEIFFHGTEAIPLPIWTLSNNFRPSIYIRYQTMYKATRMDSSRMSSARLLPVSPSMHCSRGGGVYLPGGAPTGGTCPGGVPAGGCTCPGGTCPGTPLPCEQNDWQTGVKNITFANFVCGR